MKTIRTISIAILLTVLAAVTAFAQKQQKDNNREERFKAEKVAYLTDKIGLTVNEAQKFWPVYNQAEKEKNEAFKTVFNAYRALEKAVEDEAPDNEVSALLDTYIKALDSSKSIDAKYLKQYKKILSETKVAKLYLAEESFRRQQIHRLSNRPAGSDK